jgi:DNA polymerase III delta prime subunit
MAGFLITGGSKEKRQKNIDDLILKYKPKGIVNNPDYYLLESEKEIGIEEVKNLKYWFSLKPYELPPKIVVVPETENLSSEAQSVLGKILEDLTKETIIILANSNQETILPILITNCEIIALPQEAILSLSLEELKNEEKVLEEILNMKIGQRIIYCEKLTKREEAEKFCQIQLLLWRNQMLKNSTDENITIVKKIQKTLKYLKANVNVRLSLENLLLTYPAPLK